jgi:hypothetical protein
MSNANKLREALKEIMLPKLGVNLPKSVLDASDRQIDAILQAIESIYLPLILTLKT